MSPSVACWNDRLFMTAMTRNHRRLAGQLPRTPDSGLPDHPPRPSSIAPVMEMSLLRVRSDVLRRTCPRRDLSLRFHSTRGHVLGLDDHGGAARHS